MREFVIIYIARLFMDMFSHVEMIMWRRESFVFFFFQAEDGIRDLTVTGVQTCALPILPIRYSGSWSRICAKSFPTLMRLLSAVGRALWASAWMDCRWSARCRISHESEIGRASCRERV